jgi:hypothetical protein
MSGRAIWIKEIAKEINHSEASLKRAIKYTEMEINSKYDILLCYAKWSVPKLKDVEKQEASYKRRIEQLEQLLYDIDKKTQEMKVEFGEQMQRKDQLIDSQNEIIASNYIMIAKLEKLLRGLPLASGE